MELPAILSGPPTFPDGPPRWPIRDAEVDRAVNEALQDGTWGVYHGPHTIALQADLQNAFEVDHVLLCGSGTYAVELGLRALQVGPGNEVILASYDYPGNFLCVHAVGATPVLVDVEAHDWNLSLSAVQAALTPATKAILASHLHGGSIAMRQLMELAREHGVAVLEDAAQCPGAVIQGRIAGSWGDAGVLSFGGSKLLSAGRGGALMTSRADVLQRARTHWLRGNVVCPLSEIQAAALVPQVRRLPERNETRRDNVQRLLGLLDDVPGLRPFRSDDADTTPGYYKLGFQFDAPKFGVPRKVFVAALRAEGVALSEGFGAQHVGRSPRRYRAGSALTESERAHREAVILHHPVLLGGEDDMVRVAAAIRKVYAHAATISAHAFIGVSGDERGNSLRGVEPNE